LPISLAGCVVPPAVAVASYAADGASYIASGKSLSDHGVSAVAHKDSATWHFFVGRAVCEDPKHPVPTAPLEVHNGTRQPTPTAVAAVPPAPAAPPPIGPTDPSPQLVAASFIPATPAAVPDSQPSVIPARYVETAPREMSDDRYVAIGTFSDRRRAELYVRRYADFHPSIVPTNFAGRDLMRVVLGPLDDAQRTRLRELGTPGYAVPGPFPDAPAVARSPIAGVSG
jgi:hypothetical protein